MLNRILSTLAVVLIGAAPCLAQNANYVNVREFKNWIAVFVKHRADLERCVGRARPDMQRDLFGYIDELYENDADDLKELYSATYAAYGRRGNARGPGRAGGCSEATLARTKRNYDQRFSRLATLEPAPQSQVEADFRLQPDVPDDARTCISSPPGVKPRPTGRVPMLLSGGGRWQRGRGESVMGTAALQAEVGPEGTVYAWLDVRSTSTAFKLYGDMTAAVIVADSRGRRVWNPLGVNGVAAYDTRLSMGMGGTDTRQRLVPMMFKPSCDVAYLFMKSRFCGMAENMDRRNVADNCPGVFRGPDRGGRYALPLETRDFQDFEAHLQRSNYAVGQKFRFGNWQGVRIR